MADPVKAFAREIDTATRTLYGEARGEQKVGQVAVVWVLRNRMIDTLARWGRDLEGVCTAKYQFSCWLPKDPNREKLLGLAYDDPEYTALREVVRAVMAGEIEDPTLGSNHYLVKGSNPEWVRAEIPEASFGKHDFHRL